MKNAVATKNETNRKPLAAPRQMTLAQQFHDEVDKLFEDFASGFGLSRNFFGEAISASQPKVDLKDNGTEIVITADLPGVEMHDIDIAATPHYVSVSGEKRTEQGEHDKNYYRLEREYGFFRRVVPMPCEIEKDRVDAVLRNGVLTITLPKSKVALEQERKVTVKAG